MPRSFRFDYFTLPPSKAPPGPGGGGDEKSAFARTHKVSPPGEETVHYGRAFAETEELLKRKREEHRHQASAARPKRARRAAAPEARAQVRPSAPIGALPANEEPPRPEGFTALWEEAQRNVRTMRLAVGELSDAAWRLARLPLTAVRLTRQRLMPA